MQMPNSIPVSELLVPNPGYDVDCIDDYEALYSGGRKFSERINKFVIKRKIEEIKSDSPIGGSAHYQERIKRAFYLNRGGGFLDWLSAAVVESVPKIEVGDGVSDESKSYWESLNENADGLGTPLVAIAMTACKNGLLHRRSYLRVDFEEDGKTGFISCLHPSVVDDWMHDDESVLEWARAHTCETERSEDTPWKQADTETHYWTFYLPEQIAVYTASREIGKEFAKDLKASFSELYSKEHEFGCPIFEIRYSDGQWVMERIYDVVKALLNSELDLSFALAQGAYAQPVITLNSPERVKSVVNSELGALVLEREEKYEYVSPSEKIFNPLFLNIERLKNAFYEVVQAIARDAASIPQAGRLSGTAVQKMQDPLKTLLFSFAWPIREALFRSIDGIKRQRGEEDLDIRLSGLDHFESTMDDAMSAIGATITNSTPDGENNDEENQNGEEE